MTGMLMTRRVRGQVKSAACYDSDDYLLYGNKKASRRYLKRSERQQWRAEVERELETELLEIEAEYNQMLIDYSLDEYAEEAYLDWEEYTTDPLDSYYDDEVDSELDRMRLSIEYDEYYDWDLPVYGTCHACGYEKELGIPCGGPCV